MAAQLDCADLAALVRPPRRTSNPGTGIDVTIPKTPDKIIDAMDIGAAGPANSAQHIVETVVPLENRRSVYLSASDGAALNAFFRCMSLVARELRPPVIA
jgi:hypothetical protein